MKPIFDEAKCIGCGSCVKDCVSACIYIEDGKAKARKSGCIGCGHCYAVCPTEAVSLPGLVPGSGEVRSFSEIDSELLLQAMKSRRTIRQFTSESVEREKLDMILEAGRYCPTAANAQDVAFTVLGSKQEEAEAICMSLLNSISGAAGKVSSLVKDAANNPHFFFKGAPLVIVVSGKGSGNANLASSYMEIMAESLGLGVLYSGFFIMCTRVSPKLRKLLKLPAGHKAVTCMVMGYPAVKYRRIPGRKELNINIL